MNAWMPAIIAATSAILVALAGGLLTEIGPWYRDLRKPVWNPPDWVFGPVWSIIFLCAAIAGTFAWNGAQTQEMQTLVIALFALNGTLNIAWSFLFFRLRRPDWALVENGFLWLSVLALMIALTPVSATIGLLLAPYLLWVSIAFVLNWRIVALNPRNS